MLVEHQDRLERFRQLNEDDLTRQQARHDGVGDQGVVDARVIAAPKLAGRALVEGVDAVAELAGAELAAAPAGELCLKLAQRLSSSAS